MIDSKVADINNVSGSLHAGAITAALYLQEFVDPGVPWAHLDVTACLQSRPGRPEGPKPPHCAPSTATSPKGLVSAAWADRASSESRFPLHCRSRHLNGAS
jgi:hypothetical protein